MINKINFIPVFNNLYKKHDINSSNPIIQTNSEISASCGINNKNAVDIQCTNDIKIYLGFLKRKGRVTKEEYFDIKKNHPDFILKAIKQVSKDSVREEFYTTPDKAAKIIQLLDFLIKDDSKIISVGTSPSFITEGMEALGKDVTFLPVSGGNWCIAKDTIHDYFEYYPNFKLVGDYLKYKGITPENLKDKDVIIMDFCATGRTLHLIQRLVKEYCDIDNDHVFIEDILKLISTALYQSEDDDSLPDLNLIREDLMYQKIESSSNVPHFSIYRDSENIRKPSSISSRGLKKEKLFKKFEDYSKPSARAYQLCVLHELDILGEIKNENQ